MAANEKINKYSKASEEKLDTVEYSLQDVMRFVLQLKDHTIVCGVRSKQAQNKAFKEGKSKLEWPNGKHNIKKGRGKSRAVDAQPYPLRRNKDGNLDREDFIYLGGLVVGAAAAMGLDVRWGGDWDMDGVLNKDEGGKPFLEDLYHFEIIET